MFKSARWRSEKKKIKAVFKLQFQATQVSPVRGKTLMVSLVPADVGKPTVRLQKAAVLEGKCCWEHPVYETVKLVRDPKTGRFNVKIYHFIVSTGSSKAGFLGEVSVDFADFADAINPLKVSLPLNTPNSGGILHVTIQKMQATNDLRTLEDNEAASAKELDRSLKNQVATCIRYDNIDLDFPENEEVITPDAEQHSSFTDEAFAYLKQNPMPENKAVDAIPTEKPVYRRSNTDWSVGSTSEGSLIDLANSPKENFPRDMPELANNPIELLKNEISMLERQSEISEMELQSLRKQIVKESRRGQDLSNKVASLKVERDSLNAECEQLKSTNNCINGAQDSNKLQSATEAELRVLLEESRKELRQEKSSNKRLWFKLQRREDSNSELILAVKDLEKMLEQKDADISFKEKLHEKDESNLLKKKTSQLSAEIELYRKDKEKLQMHIERLALDYETLKEESHSISSMLEENQIEKMKVQHEYSVMEIEFASVRKVVEKLEEESSALRTSMDKKEITIENLQSEMEKLRDQNSELKYCLSNGELEKEDLRKQVLKLEGEIQKNEEAVKITVKKVKSQHVTHSGTKQISCKDGESAPIIYSAQNDISSTEKLKSFEEATLVLIGEKNHQPEMSSREGKLKHNRFVKAPVNSETETCGEKEVSMPNCYKRDDSNITILLSEVSSLKERNKHMEVELKELQEKYSEVSLKFAEVESERQQLVMTLRNLKNAKNK